MLRLSQGCWNASCFNPHDSELGPHTWVTWDLRLWSYWCKNSQTPYRCCWTLRENGTIPSNRLDLDSLAGLPEWCSSLEFTLLKKTPCGFPNILLCCRPTCTCLRDMVPPLSWSMSRSQRCQLWDPDHLIWFYPWRHLEPKEPPSLLIYWCETWISFSAHIPAHVRSCRCAPQPICDTSVPKIRDGGDTDWNTGAQSLLL